MIKDAVDQNGGAVRDDSPVTEVLNQVCPSSWRGACKTAVQLLFGQAGLVSLTFEHLHGVWSKNQLMIEKLTKIFNGWGCEDFWE